MKSVCPQALLELKQAAHPELGPDIKTLRLSVEAKVPDLVHVKITDAANKRWEVPDQLLADSAEQIKSKESCTIYTLVNKYWMSPLSHCQEPFSILETPKHRFVRHLVMSPTLV